MVSAEYNNILTPEERTAIAGMIADIEKKTSAELRVGIRLKRGRKETAIPLAELALNEFYYLGMDKTGMRTGVLFFFLLSEREYRLMLDDAVFQRIDSMIVNEIEQLMKKSYTSGSFFEPLKNALQTFGETLALHFPILPEDVNELPNEVSIR